ncbi:IscA/HesB family protein [Megalodesulfovibrio paquesii]
MIHLTENAVAELDAYFADKPKSTIRIYLAPGGCSGPRLALALDEANDADAVVTQGAYTLAMDKQLYEQAKPLTIDVSHMGFSVDSSLELGGGCGGGCSSGGCGTGSSSGCGCQ